MTSDGMELPPVGTTFVCIQCPYCLGGTDIHIPPDMQPGTKLHIEPVWKMMTLPMSVAGEIWGELAGLLGMSLNELCEMAGSGDGALMHIVIVKLRERKGESDA